MTRYPPLIDPYNRKINYLRVSVTDRCDFRCVYCMSEKMQFLPKKDLLTLEELDKICSVFIEMGITKLRITGGEPLVRRNILSFFKSISRHLITGDLKELTLTTNGSQLKKFARPLFDLGVKRVNISLDTLNPEKFKRITRWGKLDQVLDGIREAKKAGLAIKINKVALKKTNQDELNKFIQWCGDEGFDLTFIEVMPMGDFGEEDRLDQFWSLKDLREKIDKKWTLKDLSLTTGGPARYSEISETGQKVGFITPLTHNFCESCNRVRMTCTGQLFMCLGQEEDADLRSALREGSDNDYLLRKRIMQAVDRKPKGHDFDYSRKKISGQMSRFMSHTGG
jgi:cyclic pyranopterin phosphate synthase